LSDIVTPPKSAGTNDEYYKQRIKYNILKEAYQQDYEANRLNTSDNNILLTEIQKKFSASGDIEEYRTIARGMNIKEHPLIQFVGNIDEDTITITDRGRTYYEDNKTTEIDKLDL
jgi:hypothetical protein